MRKVDGSRVARSLTAVSVHKVYGSRGPARTLLLGTGLGLLYETGSAGNGPWKLIMVQQGGGRR